MFQATLVPITLCFQSLLGSGSVKIGSKPGILETHDEIFNFEVFQAVFETFSEIDNLHLSYK